MSATIGRVPRPRGTLSDATLKEIAFFKRHREAAEATYREAVVAALAEGSFSVVAKATGLSTNTLQRWKREAEE